LIQEGCFVPKIDIRQVSVGFGSGRARAQALDGIDATLQSGLFTIISGPSGSGKTSLLSVIGAILSPDSGSVHIEGIDITHLDSRKRTIFRREYIGYVFQLFRLMPALNAEENIRLSLELRRKPSDRRRAIAALEQVGLADKAHLRPRQMSGGEQQRVAVARAIAHDPMVILADEPTASLDTANGLNVTKLLAEFAEDKRRIVIVVTHDPRVLPFARHTISMKDGRIVTGDSCVVSSNS
jgi:putative ABC transport system ATP-binding protein